VRPAHDADHTRRSAKAIVPGKRIGLEITLEARQKPFRTVASATWREVVCGGLLSDQLVAETDVVGEGCLGVLR
jgi:hypothetical protein